MNNKITFLKKIANNTGGSVSKMNNELYLLKKIASNVGATVTGSTKNKLHYLKAIADHTEDYESRDDYVAVIGDKDVIQVDDTVTLRAKVVFDGENMVGKTVTFYEGEE